MIFYFFSLDGALLRLVGLLSEPVVELLAPGRGPIFLFDSGAATRVKVHR